MISKYLLSTYIFCVGIAVYGVITIISTSVVISRINLTKTSSKMLYALPVVLLICNCWYMLGASLGLWGARTRNALFLIISFLSFVVLGTTTFLSYVVILLSNVITLKKDISYAVYKIWEERLTNHEHLDIVQLEFNCCGKMSYADYESVIMPASCCGKEVTNCVILKVKSKMGCLKAVPDLVLDDLHILLYSAIPAEMLVLLATTSILYLLKEIFENSASDE